MVTDKRKRTVLTLDEKLDICKRLKKGATITSLSTEFGIGKSTICDIKRNKDKLASFASKLDSTEGSSKRKTMKTASNTRLDDALYLWFSQKRSQGIPISGPILMAKALELNEKLDPNNQQFKASTGWLKNFQSRHGIRQLAIQGETMSANKESVESFTKTLSQLIEEKGLVLSQVYNCDETGLYWKALPDKTLASHNESRAPGYKVSKERITLLVCSNATGEHKLPLTVIGKAKNPRALKNLSHSALPVRYTSQKNAWMTSELFQEWFFHEFIPATTRYLKAKNLPVKALLLLDNAPAHPSTDLLQSEDGSFTCLFLPPNTTSLIQPMDQSVLESTKRRYRKELLKKLLLADSTTSTDAPELTIIEFWKKLNIKDAMFMVAEAWNDVPESTIQASWKKLLNEETASTESPGSVDSETIPDFLQVLECIQGCEDCDAADVQKWLEIDASDQGYEILSDEDIVRTVIEAETTDVVHNDDKLEEEEPNSIPSHAEVHDMLTKCLPWVECQPELQ